MARGRKVLAAAGIASLEDFQELSAISEDGTPISFENGGLLQYAAAHRLHGGFYAGFTA
jgi:hypothetical protein